MNAQDLEQRARELLEAECAPFHVATHISSKVALRAIAAALRQQPAPVDLEQFRGAVMFLKERASQLSAEDVSRDKFISEADRLLSIINAGKVCPCGEPTCTESWEPGCGLGESVEHAVPAEREPPRGDELRAILARQPAPVVDDALADTQRAIIEAAERRGYERAKAELDAAIAALDAPFQPNAKLKKALARQQGVQS